MRILIDGSALVAETPEKAFWLGIVSTLAYMSHEVFLLDRQMDRQSQPGCKNLHAPPVDFKDALKEDRRLAALCSELQIDYFISTEYTSAGAHVRSVFVATDLMLDLFQRNPALQASGLRSARLAFAHFATTEKAARDLSGWSGIALEYIRLLDNPADLISVGGSHTEDIRTREEEAILTEINRLRVIEQAEAEQKWHEAIQQFGRLPLIPRMWRAARNVHRYPEYLKRLLS